MDFYEYQTNKGVIPYRLIRGLREIFSENDDVRNIYGFKKPEQKSCNYDNYTDFIKHVERIKEVASSGNISLENPRSGDYKSVLKFMENMRHIYYENKELKELFESKYKFKYIPDEYIGQTKIR